MSQEKIEVNDLKLYLLAQKAVDRNLSPYQMSQHVRNLQRSDLQQFFRYYSGIKKENFTDEAYQKTLEEFKEQYDRELLKRHENYNHLFNKDTRLDNVINNILQEEERSEEKTINISY